MHRDFITGQNLDKVHPELAGNMSQYRVSVADVNGEHRIWQRIRYDALKLDYVVFCQVPLTSLVWAVLTEYGQRPA